MPYIPKEADRPRTADLQSTTTDVHLDPNWDQSIRTTPLHPVDPDLEFDPEDITNMAIIQGDAPVTAAMLTGLTSGSNPWECIVGQTFTAAIVIPPLTFTGHLGARVEAPGTRAVVSAWHQATLTGDMYTVTLDSPLAAGPYEVVWITDEPISSFGPVFIPLIAVTQGPGGDASTWPAIDVNAVRPTLAEVAELEGSRTREIDTGVPVGTFNDTTYPTGSDVEGLIDNAVSDVLALIPDIIDPDLWPRVKVAIKYLTAVTIEQSFFRVDGRSSGTVLTYMDRLNRIITALNETNANPAIRLA